VLTWELVQDTFEDAPDITPRPRAKSPTSTRSLTERRTSSSTIPTITGGDGAAEPALKTNSANIEGPKTNGHASHELIRKISTSELDDVDLVGGKSLPYACFLCTAAATVARPRHHI
jgi:hypothetical protein